MERHQFLNCRNNTFNSTNMNKFIVFAALFAVAAASDAYNRPTYSEPKYSAPAYSAPAYSASSYEKEYPAQPYSFAYDVKDGYTYVDFGHTESSDGKVTTGSYRVVLPDGRTQIVNYKADYYGYVADVKYEGEAKYPEYVERKSYPAPIYTAPTYTAPSYKAPAYTAPTYSAPSYKAPVVYTAAPAYAATQKY